MATAPNQKRVAVVSAPVADGRGERADEKLNAALGEALKMMKARVEEKGFRDNKHARRREASCPPGFVWHRDAEDFRPRCLPHLPSVHTTSCRPILQFVLLEIFLIFTGV